LRNHALRLRAETVARMEPFHEDRHFGVQARACPRGSICNQATKVLQRGEYWQFIDILDLKIDKPRLNLG